MLDDVRLLTQRRTATVGFEMAFRAPRLVALLVAVLLAVPALGDARPNRRRRRRRPPPPPAPIEQIIDVEEPETPRDVVMAEVERNRQEVVSRRAHYDAHDRARLLHGVGLFTAIGGGGSGLLMAVLGIALCESRTTATEQRDLESGACGGFTGAGFALFIVSAAVGVPLAIYGARRLKALEQEREEQDELVLKPKLDLAVDHRGAAFRLRWRF